MQPQLLGVRYYLVNTPLAKLLRRLRRGENPPGT